ncbi:MAG: HD domain-containing protein [Clostridia bacterium]|nr:HD domain-containing protein [Clostridia bacterium]
MHKGKNRTVAVMDVGSHSIRFMVAQITAEGGVIPLEDLWKPTNIGRDTFAYGKVQVETIHHTCEILKGFFKLMQDYRVKHYRAVSTSGIREAQNRDYILEQIRLKSGFVVEVINNAQERFFMYKALRENLPDAQKIRDKGTLILDIGSGGVEVSAYSKGNLKFTEYLKVGSLRLRELLADLEKLTLDFPSVMEEFVESRIGFLRPRIEQMNIKYFIGLGGELKTIRRLCESIGLDSEDKFIKKSILAKLYSKVNKMTTDQIVCDYGLQRNQAEVLLPSIMIFYRFLQMTGADEIYAPLLSLRHGILVDMADEFFDTPGKRESLNDIISSVWYIGKKYMVEEVHCQYIERIALAIFDQTEKNHRMGDRERFFLQVACILHDVGKHINLNRHDIHSYNIIRNQDIMGVSSRELNLIANIARYHSEETPELSHENYAVLNDCDRVIVSKLAAILQLAEALDISHKQKIEKIEITASGRELIFKVKSTSDILLEQQNFVNSAMFFEEVMGNKPLIKRKG